MSGTLHRLWRSVGFRLAFYYGVLAAITTLAALAILYMQTVGVLQHRMARDVSNTMLQLTGRFEDGGTGALAMKIDRAIADDRDSDHEIYLLIDRDGRKLAGNLDQAPEVEADTGIGVHRRVQRAGKSVKAYLVLRRLAGGALLVVGHDLRDQDAIESLVVSATAAAGIVAVLLLVGGTFIFRQELERSVGAMRRTAARVAAGELHERVALSGDEDQFARLEHDINAMLDRIESLMDGVRHVSNTIAHNLRTPLTRILVLLRQAEQQGASRGQQQHAIATSIREIEELTIAFDKLLQIAEAEAGARRQQFAPVAVHAIADDVKDLYDAVAENQGAMLLREPAEEAIALGDRDLLAGAVANLVDNALKYAGAGASVRIGTQAVDGWAVVTVQDNGPGIPRDEYERVGLRFHRLNRSTPGHGLGLAGVRAVIALHAGRLQFSDAGPGLHVRVQLPEPPA